MGKKYLRAYKTRGRCYWWLVETSRECGKVRHEKLRYWGINEPGKNYKDIIMPLDDGQPLNDLWLIWQTNSGVWHWQQRGDFVFWQRRGQEEWFWKSFFEYVSTLYASGVTDVWLTRASKRSAAIRNVKEERAIKLLKWVVFDRLKGGSRYDEWRSKQ